MKPSLFQTERWENNSKQLESTTFFSFQGSGQPVLGGRNPSDLGHVRPPACPRSASGCPSGLDIPGTPPQGGARAAPSPTQPAAADMEDQQLCSECFCLSSSASPLRLGTATPRRESFPPLCLHHLVPSTSRVQRLASTQKLHLSFYSFLTPPPLEPRDAEAPHLHPASLLHPAFFPGKHNRSCSPTAQSCRS